MPYSLYVDSDSARCISHPIWHSHSCLCCRDVVAIEMLWLRDSLIVRMGGLVVKSTQCSECFFISHKAVLNIAVIVKSNWQSIRGERFIGSRSQRKGGVVGAIMVVAPSIWGGWAMSDVWSVRSLMELGIFNFLKKFQVFIQNFLKLQFPPESNEKFPAKC